MTAKGTAASKVLLLGSFLGWITRRDDSTLASRKYSPPIPTTRCRIGPRRGFTIPKPRLTMITNILSRDEENFETDLLSYLASVLLAQETTSAMRISPSVA